VQEKKNIDKFPPPRLVQNCHQVLAEQAILNTLGIPLTVVWVPDSRQDKHGEIKSSTIFIYSPSESDAWNTFTHEIVEFKLKDVTSTYRTIINTFIEALEKLAYERKEQFIEFLPKLFEEINKSKR
jgi:hypothetical protein